MLEVMGQDYIRTAYAKGLPHRLILTRHALRNALGPFLTMTGLSLAYMMGGSIIVETVFAWPGIGLLAYTSIIRRDYNVVLCIVTMVAAGFVIINVLVDIVIGYVDPRVRREGIKIL
jgi:ABC-type dipeptide/oligopeptide/nickel transport system permease component